MTNIKWRVYDIQNLIFIKMKKTIHMKNKIWTIKYKINLKFNIHENEQYML